MCQQWTVPHPQLHTLVSANPIRLSVAKSQELSEPLSKVPSKVLEIEFHREDKYLPIQIALVMSQAMKVWSEVQS